MNSILIGGTAMVLVAIPHKVSKSKIFDCLPDTESYDCFCNMDDSYHKHK